MSTSPPHSREIAFPKTHAPLTGTKRLGGQLTAIFKTSSLSSRTAPWAPQNPVVSLLYALLLSIDLRARFNPPGRIHLELDSRAYPPRHASIKMSTLPPVSSRVHPFTTIRSGKKPSSPSHPPHQHPACSTCCQCPSKRLSLPLPPHASACLV